MGNCRKSRQFVIRFVMEIEEEWRPVEGWPYEVSSLGRVRRTLGGPGTWAGRIIKARVGPRGYLMVPFSRDGENTQKLVHRLMCAAFHGPAPSPRHVVAHNDGTRTNNSLENLRWATPLENTDDMFRHGTPRFGGLPGGCKLTADSVREIRALLSSGRSNRRVAKMYGVSSSTISSIRLGQIWTRVA